MWKTDLKVTLSLTHCMILFGFGLLRLLFLGLKALAHYKDFHKDFSEKIVVKIFVQIQNCCSCEEKL
mgnify:CR=1 FL=1